MDKLIENGNELKDWFFSVNKMHNANERLSKGVFVDGKVMKDLLVSACQGNMIIDGTVSKISFEVVGAGVYRAFLEQM